MSNFTLTIAEPKNEVENLDLIYKRSANGVYPLIGILVSLLALGSAVFTWIPGITAISIAAWVLLGPGVALRWFYSKRSIQTRTLFIFLSGIVLLMATTMAEAGWNFWNPKLTVEILSVLSLVSAYAQLSLEWNGFKETLPKFFASLSGKIRSATSFFQGEVINKKSVWLITVSLLVVGGVQPLLSKMQSNVFGLIASGVPGAALGVAFLIILLTTIYSLWKKDMVGVVYGVLATIVAFRISTVFASSVPLYSWTYKHLGVVDYITTHHHLVSSSLDIYYGWPALFTFSAWFTSVSGLTLLSIASFFVVFIHLAQALAVYMLAREFSLAKIYAWGAVFLAEIFNWVGQDYYSPQAVAFILAIFFIVVLLRSRREPKLIWWSLPIFAMVTVTHQLTPYWLLVVVFAFCFFKLIQPRWIFIPMGIFAAGWALLNIHTLMRYGVFSGFDPLANASRPSYGMPSLSNKITEWAMRITAVSVWGSALVMLFLRYFHFPLDRKTKFWPHTILMLSPFVLLGGQSYGGEAIFRVYLYSIPVAAVILAESLIVLLHKYQPVIGKHTTRGSGYGRFAVVKSLLAATLMILIGVASIQASYGGWFNNVISTASYNAVEKLYATLPSDTLQISIGMTGPGRSDANYVRFLEANPFYDGSLANIDPRLLTESFKNPIVLSNLTYKLQSEKKPVILVWMSEMENYSTYYGLRPAGSDARLIKQLENNVNWKVTLNQAHVKIFTLVR